MSDAEIAAALNDGGTYAPDEVPEDFAAWVREQVQKRQEGDDQ